MSNRTFIIVFAILCSPFALSEKTQAQIHDEYVVKAGSEELHFVQRPDLGYVVQAKKEETAIKSLEENLKQFKAKNVLRVGGRGRKGISVVLEQRSAAENPNTIAALQAQSHIRYAAPLFSAGGETVAIIPEIVVRVIPGTNQDQLETLCQSLSVNIKERLEFTEFEYLIEIPRMDADSVFHAIEQLNQKSIVQWAVPNVVFRPQLLGQVIPNDEYFPNQWHLNNTGQSGGTPGADINAPAAWEITTGNPNIVVAVLDEGVDTDHPDLIDNIVAGYDFDDYDSDPNPIGNGAHGTACAGLIAGKGNNGIGITGVAWNCKIMPIRIPFGDVYVIESDIATAIRWAANNGADILSNSWGWPGSYSSPTIYSAIIDVTTQGGIGRDGKGCVVLFASGNWESGGPVMYPAKYPEVIAVGATDHNDNIWYYSGSGPELDIVAPSGDCNLLGNIWTTDIVGSAGYNNRNPSILDYTDKMGGTSAACPIAAGAAALVLSLEPTLTNNFVQDALQDSAIGLCGRIDARSALQILPMLPEQRWVMRYNGPGNSIDVAQALALDNLGNIYVTGYSQGNGTGYDYATIKYDPNGNMKWVARYNGPGNWYDYAYAIAVDNSGNVYVTGTSPDINRVDDYATVKYDTNGNQLWVRRYNSSSNGDDEAHALAIDNLGNVYVTGWSDVNSTYYDYTTIKYGHDGTELWVKFYNNSSVDKANALAIDGFGNVYVTGESSGSTDYDYATIKYDTSGNQIWVRRYNGPKSSSRDSANALAIDGLGNIYVTGESESSGSPYSDYATIKYDANGNQMWVNRYSFSLWDDDIAHALTVDGVGNVYVTGVSTGGYATIKYDANGNQMWVSRYTSGSARALAVDNLGNIYVTGGSASDYATVKYDPNGKQLWVRRYNGPGNGSDAAYALAVDSVGNTYVTGSSIGTAFADYATIKYSRHEITTGSLCVTIYPQEAIDAGAQWRRIGTLIWYDSGYMEPNISVGPYTVEFKDVNGWETPVNLPININNDQTTNTSGTYTAGYGGGNGTEGNPYLIYTTGQMYAIGANPSDWNKHFKLMADINLSGYVWTEFNNIGGYETPFTGVFEGNGYLIQNFKYFSSNPDVGLGGLFGYVSGGNIRNLGMVDVNVAALSLVGGLVGLNSGGSITDCYAVGGTVNGQETTGGLVGQNDGFITDCYATGSVVGNFVTGGLVGGNSGNITNCYAVGTVNGQEVVGGLVADNFGTVTNSFWDVNTTGQSSSAGGEGKTTEEMYQKSTFTSAGWDFLGETVNGSQDIWRMCVDGVSYPLLSWQFNEGDFGCPDGVNFSDYTYFAIRWNQIVCDSSNNFCDGTDFDHDGMVNIEDLKTFAENWLLEY